MTATQSLIYPASTKGDQVDHYHGTTVADPYRWLENPDSLETRAWIEAQNKVTEEFLSKIPARDRIRQRLTELWDFEKYGIPFKQGDRYFYFKNDGLQNQSVLYTLNSLADQPSVLLDPNTLSLDGTVALSGISISEDGNLLAYGISTSGSEWQEWKVRDITTNTDLCDHIKWVKFSGTSWTHDGKGFFYSRYNEPNEKTRLEEVNYFQKLYYHRLGTPQSEDILIYERPDQKEWGFSGRVTEDGRYLIVSVWMGTDPRNLVFYKDLEAKHAPVVELINTFEAKYSFINNDGTRFWFRTDLDAPRSRLIAIDINQGDRVHWQELIPQSDETMQGISVLNNQFIVSYLKDARSQIKIFELDGRPVREIELPGIASAGGFGGKRHDTETFYSFTSFTTPNTIYRYDLETGKSTLFRQPEVDFNPQDYETCQVFYRSKDGTQIPMFIVHKKGIQLDGSNPT